jgi:hypothetical protein
VGDPERRADPPAPWGFEGAEKGGGRKRRVAASRRGREAGRGVRGPPPTKCPAVLVEISLCGCVVIGPLGDPRGGGGAKPRWVRWHLESN